MTLAEYLTEKDLSDAEVARALDTEPSTVGRWRKRETSPDAGNLEKLLHYCGGRCSIGELRAVRPAAPSPESKPAA